MKHQEQVELHSDSFNLLERQLSHIKVSHFFDTVKDLLVNYFVVFEGMAFLSLLLLMRYVCENFPTFASSMR